MKHVCPWSNDSPLFEKKLYDFNLQLNTVCKLFEATWYLLEPIFSLKSVSCEFTLVRKVRIEPELGGSYSTEICFPTDSGFLSPAWFPSSV